MNSASIITISSLIIGLLLMFSLLKKEKTEGLKLFLFWGMVIPIVLTTLYLAAATVMKNQQSATGGPVHWHADYEIYICGQSQEKELPPTPSLLKEGEKGGVQGATLAHAEEEEIDLLDPQGISNRIGSSDFHEHGDNRIHVEGVVKNLADVSLVKFFEVVGGRLTATYLRLPTNHGELIVQNGMTCPSGEQGTLQVFVYQTRDNVVSQKKLTRFTDYVISPYSTVPPGDCLIIEFGPSKAKTEKICKFYEIALNQGELKLSPSSSPP